MKPAVEIAAVVLAAAALVSGGVVGGVALARQPQELPTMEAAPPPKALTLVEGPAGKASVQQRSTEAEALGEPASGTEGSPHAAPGDSLPSPAQAPEADGAGDAEGLSAAERETVSIFRSAAPSVVFITRMSRSPLSLDATQLKSGSGSGILWDENGHVVTNHHVVDGAASARVTLADRSTYVAKLVGSAPDKDIAVLKIDAPKEKLRALAIGSSERLLVGQHVYAIGNPFGLDHTLSTGVISGLGREIKAQSGHPITGVVQTDAAINPGNSGGPLLDSKGRLIGINTAIYSPSGASAGIGFAVPVDTVKRIVPQLIEHGKIVRPGLGISIADRVRGVKGVVVMGVREGSGAEAAGLVATTRDKLGHIQLGDVIVGMDGHMIGNNTDLFRVLDDKKVGDVVELTVDRGGQLRKVKVELTALND